MDQTCLVLMLVSRGGGGQGQTGVQSWKASMFQSRCEVSLAYRTALAPISPTPSSHACSPSFHSCHSAPCLRSVQTVDKRNSHSGIIMYVVVSMDSFWDEGIIHAHSLPDAVQ